MAENTIKFSEQLSSNWNYTNIQLDFYFAFAKDQHTYQCSIQGMPNTNLKDATITLIASMKQFVKSIQYLFYEYLKSEDYQKDITANNWKYKFTSDNYHNLTLDVTDKTLHEKLPLMIWIVDYWSQKYGCFRTYNQKVVYESFEDELDAQM
jgi:hypothetical protein